MKPGLLLPGSVYMTLDRLEKRGMLESYATEPTPERGGRAKRCYTATAEAIASLRESQRALLSLWEGLRLID